MEAFYAFLAVVLILRAISYPASRARMTPVGRRRSEKLSERSTLVHRSTPSRRPAIFREPLDGQSTMPSSDHFWARTEAPLARLTRDVLLWQQPPRACWIVPPAKALPVRWPNQRLERTQPGPADLKMASYRHRSAAFRYAAWPLT